MKDYINFRLKGNDVKPPLEWASANINAAFDTEVQPNIDIDNVTFVNEGANEIRQHIQNGNIFEGIPLDIELRNNNDILEVFNGYLDLTEDFEEISPVKVRSKIKTKSGIQNLENDINSLTFGLLEDKGVLTSSHYTRIPYLVEKQIYTSELIITSVSLYILTKEIAENSEKLAQDIATALGIGAAGATGAAGSTIYQVAAIVLRAAYILVMLRAAYDLLEDIITTFISPTRYHRGIKLRTALEKGFEYLGYEFVSPISDLDLYHYAPSLDNEDSRLSGIPRPKDYGFIFGEFVQLCKNLFYARLAIVDGKVHLRTDNDQFWIKNSSFKLDDVLLEDINIKKYNTDELDFGYSVRFQTDISDEWTIESYFGTSYSRYTEMNGATNQDLVTLKGYNEVNLPIALGNRKNRLNVLEESLRVLAVVADELIKVFGGSSNFQSRISNRVGMLKISQEFYAVPKLLVLNGGSMPVNHVNYRAKYLYNTYHSASSFVIDNNYRQRAIYNEVKIKFGFNDFIKTINNSYFTTSNGGVGKFINIRWNFASDVAFVDFWIQQKYTDKLSERFIETR